MREVVVMEVKVALEEAVAALEARVAMGVRVATQVVQVARQSHSLALELRGAATPRKTPSPCRYHRIW